MEKVPLAGFDIIGLWISGLQRSLSLKNLLFPFKVISSLWKARKIVKEFKPDLAIGTGGYASAPVMKAAANKGIPYVIQEQNSYAGITNKLLAKKAAKICVAYEGMEKFFPIERIVLTGNPVREILLDGATDRTQAYAAFGMDPARDTVFVLGGSLGSARINALIADHLDWFRGLGLQVLWQCGKGYYEMYKQHDSKGVRVRSFINDMDQAYSIADMIISRAGAGTISELCIVGKPVFLIPSPHVAEDHQTKNAQALVAKRAAIMIPERELDSRFPSEFERVYRSDQERAALAENIKSMARPGATQAIVDEIENLLVS